MANSGTFEERARVAVVDDDADTRERLKEILQSQKTFTFAGGFSNGGEALKSMPILRPDLALMDIKLPDMDGIECTERLKQIVPSLKIVIVSENRESTSFDRSFAAGAVTYLIKPLDPDQLIATLRFISLRANETAKDAHAIVKKDPNVILNPHEKEVLCKLADGLLYKEISGALGISYTAVRKRQHNIFKKLHVANRSEAIRIWLRNRNEFRETT